MSKLEKLKKVVEDANNVYRDAYMDRAEAEVAVVNGKMKGLKNK